MTLKMLVIITVTLLLIRSALGVINGEPLLPSETRSLVKLHPYFANYNGAAKLCGGVLISENAVLTAAHCLTANSFSVASNVTVVLNYYEPSAPNKKKTHGTESFFIHSNFLKTGADMAIVFIEPLQCQKDGPQVALLPPQFRYKPNDGLGPSVTDEEIGKATCFAFGWGVTENERSPEWPHIIYLNIRREWNGKLTGLWTSSFTKTCKGDSGSPVYCVIHRKRYLIGVISSLEFNKIVDSNMNAREWCMQSDYVTVTDIRDNADEIMYWMRKKKQIDRFLKGQEECQKFVAQK